MTNLQLFSNDLFPAWMNFDQFDNYTYENGKHYIDHTKNKYRWDETNEAYKLDILMPGLTKKDIELTFKESLEKGTELSSKIIQSIGARLN